MSWNKQPKVQRPEYPKLVPIPGTADEARGLLPLLRHGDPDASVEDGGARGVYVRVHNAAAETAAKLYRESRSFPLD